MPVDHATQNSGGDKYRGGETSLTFASRFSEFVEVSRTPYLFLRLTYTNDVILHIIIDRKVDSIYISK